MIYKLKSSSYMYHLNREVTLVALDIGDGTKRFTSTDACTELNIDTTKIRGVDGATSTRGMTAVTQWYQSNQVTSAQNTGTFMKDFIKASKNEEARDQGTSSFQNLKDNFISWALDDSAKLNVVADCFPSLVGQNSKAGKALYRECETINRIGMDFYLQDKRPNGNKQTDLMKKHKVWLPYSLMEAAGTLNEAIELESQREKAQYEKIRETERNKLLLKKKTASIERQNKANEKRLEKLSVEERKKWENHLKENNLPPDTPYHHGAMENQKKRGRRVNTRKLKNGIYHVPQEKPTQTKVVSTDDGK